MRLQSFHAALGEDSQIYSPDEETETFGLFDKEIEEEEKDKKLAYLMMIRDIKKKNAWGVRANQKYAFPCKGRKKKQRL